MSTTIYKKSSKDADIEIKRLQDRLMAEVVNNLYPQTAIEDNATVQKIREVLEKHGFRIFAQHGGHIVRTPSVRSIYILEKVLSDKLNLEYLFTKISKIV